METKSKYVVENLEILRSMKVRTTMYNNDNAITELYNKVSQYTPWRGVSSWLTPDYQVEGNVHLVIRFCRVTTLFYRFTALNEYNYYSICHFIIYRDIRSE